MKQQRGFTLVELSIVLVILGLLIGGVLTGQSLIRAAELRSVTTQQARFVTATQTFRDKYFALPGDTNNAQSYWGIAHATPATCITTASTTAVTCNGNGDGMVASSAGSNELFRFWQHLANAGLIEGSYDGIAYGSGQPFGATVTNSPAGKLSSSFWSVGYAAAFTNEAFAFNGAYGNYLEIGGLLANNQPSTPIFKPEEAYNIDMKLDDGKPGTGSVVVMALGGVATCTDGANSAAVSANYLLAGASKTCALYFRQAF